MGAPGISEIQVFEAADRLKSNGLSITVEAIRNQIGSGSYTTIMKHLDRWKEMVATPSKIPKAPEAISKHIEKIWEISFLEADSIFAHDRDSFNAEKEQFINEKSSLIAEVEKVETELGKAFFKIKVLEERTAQFEQIERKLNDDLSLIRAQLEATEARRIESSERADRLEQQMANLLKDSLLSAKKLEESGKGIVS
ncbi:MAG: DNA-binding protein [Oligoflexia bacterium]|nr:DNA-binding protein [Oligoflexia bacterium]